MAARLLYVPDATQLDNVIELLRDYPEVMGVSDIARYWGVSEETVRRKVASGELRSFKVGRRVLITKTALLEFMGEVGTC